MKLLISLCVILSLSPQIKAANSFAGKWDLTIVQRGFAMEGLLELREAENGLVAFAEGGPVRLSITGQDIEMGILRKMRKSRLPKKYQIVAQICYLLLSHPLKRKYF